MISSLLKYVWVRVPLISGLFYKPRKRTYLFLPINGAGLGHLTRLLAVAHRLKRAQPDAEIVFFTTSIGVALVHREGFMCHHVPPAALLNTGAIDWNKLFCKSLKNALDVHRPSVLVFDGTIPYLGLQRVMHSYRKIRYAWIKRGLYKEGVDFARLETLSKGFEVVISPGELDSKYDENVAGSRFQQIEPVSLLDAGDLLPKDTARRILRLDPSKSCVYLQLGAGNINGIHGVQDKIIELLKKKGFQVVLGQSPISLSPKPDLRADSVIVDYPNSKYFNAFDFAVLAGGYNSVCEAVTLGLPAIFLPNTETGADDQLKRVLSARAIGNYEVIREYSDAGFEQAVEKLLTNERLESGNKQSNGAETAAKLIGQL